MLANQKTWLQKIWWNAKKYKGFFLCVCEIKNPMGKRAPAWQWKDTDEGFEEMIKGNMVMDSVNRSTE